MKKISYSDLLSIMVQNLDNHFYKFGKFCIQYNEYLITYELDGIFHFNTSSTIRYGYCHFVDADGNYYYISNNHDVSKVPKTKEDWFIFAIQYEHTEEDFNNFLKIHNYVKTVN